MLSDPLDQCRFRFLKESVMVFFVRFFGPIQDLIDLFFCLIYPLRTKSPPAFFFQFFLITDQIRYQFL